MALRSLRIDPFLLLMIGTVAAASILPTHGSAAGLADTVTNLAIALLFFLHGAKLSRDKVRDGMGALRVHLAVLTATFLLFPVFGLAAHALLGPIVPTAVLNGVLFLTLLPSTVQSSIAMTAMAKGNVPAAVCSASLSNLVGIIVTPMLAALLLRSGPGSHAISGDAVVKIALQLLAPFLLGHFTRPWTGRWIDRHARLVARWDRGTILLVVYTAFSASVVEGLWNTVSAGDLLTILVVDAALLGTMLTVLMVFARKAGFAREDEVVIVFAGSKKSLASGVPMAGALFPAALIGPMILPLMLYHQMQLMICSALASWYANPKRAGTSAVATPAQRVGVDGC